MAQIVIDIDDKTYKAFMELILVNIGRSNYKGIIGKCLNAIKHGVVLPKGHGGLGDLDKIQSMARKKAEDCFPEGRYDYGYRKALFDFAKDIDDAPTIIEADREGE